MNAKYFKYLRIILIHLPILALSSCHDDEPAIIGETPLVVEGWIERGEAPVVMVTRAVDMTSDSPSFDDFVEKWCRVSIFDYDTRYILSGKIDKNYTTPCRQCRRHRIGIYSFWEN